MGPASEHAPREFVDKVRLILRRERVAQEFSQHEVAIAMGVSYSSILAWELGKTNPSWEHLRKWAGILGYKINVSVEVVKVAEDGLEDEVIPVLDTPDVPRVVIRSREQ